jgi:hypothetical protein
MLKDEPLFPSYIALRNRHAAIEQRGGDEECSVGASAPADISCWLEARKLSTFQAQTLPTMP